MGTHKHIFTHALTFSSLLFAFSGMLIAPQALAQEIEELDPAEIANGERLFVETRFAQFFKTFLDNGGDTNAPLTQGDSSLDKAVNWKLTPEQRKTHLKPDLLNSWRYEYLKGAIKEWDV